MFIFCYNLYGDFMQKFDDDYEYDNGFKPKKVILKENYPFYNRNFFFMLCSFLLIWASRFVLFLYRIFYSGLKITGKKNLKGNRRGNIFISNHVMNLDAFYIVVRTYFTKVYITVLQSNLGFPIFSRYVRFCGAVPIPEDRKLLRNFNNQTETILKKGKNVLFFPEAKLNPFCDHIRPFESGAFHYANKYETDIVPIVFTFHKPRGWYRLIHKNRPVPRLNYLPVYKLPKGDSNREIIQMAKSELHQIMSDYFDKNSDYYDNKLKQES